MSPATLHLASQGSSISGAYNRRISGYGLSPSVQIGSLRSPTSDMRQQLGDIACHLLEALIYA